MSAALVRRSVARVLLPFCCLLAWMPSGARADDGHCSVTASPGAGLDVAVALFAERCAAHERRDCDPVGGAWRCSSRVIGAEAPNGAAAVPDAPAAALPTTAFGTPLDIDGGCRARGADLDAARDAFAAACPDVPRVDCDPIGGEWTCASEVLGTAAPGGRVAAASDPSPAAAPAPTPAPETDAPAAVPEAPAAPTPVPETSPAPEAPEAPDAPAAPVAAASPPATTDAPPEPADADDDVARIGLLRDGDLLALMYDNCSDPDDGHAAAAALAVIVRTGAPAPWIVNGTCGANLENRFQPRSVALMDAVWGDDWLNAHADRAGTVSASADAWAAVLANGREVWIAEGGPSDVTAEIVREIAARYPSLDTRGLHVVQHSDWNEEHTAPANLALVRSATDYRKLDDGNRGGNGTADLNPTGDAYDRLSGAFVDVATSGPFAGEWRAAFDYLSPGCPRRDGERCKLDFSDAVELLHIVGDTATADVADFAERYLR